MRFMSAQGHGETGTIRYQPTAPESAPLPETARGVPHTPPSQPRDPQRSAEKPLGFVEVAEPRHDRAMGVHHSAHLAPYQHSAPTARPPLPEEAMRALRPFGKPAALLLFAQPPECGIPHRPANALRAWRRHLQGTTDRRPAAAAGARGS